MKGLSFQLKSLLRDKLCIITFLLPIFIAIGISLISDTSFSSISDTLFYVVDNELSSDTLEWLAENGTVTSYESEQSLIDAINNPSTQAIGVRVDGDSIKTIISGDEYSLYNSIANTLPTLYENKDVEQWMQVDITPVENTGNELENLLVAITMVTAVFMSLTYSTMNMISEKEDGVAFVNETLPLSTTDYILQKISLGFIGGMLSTIITALICIRLSMQNLLLLIILLAISTFISAMIGICLGKKIESLMVGIVVIKVLMIVFIAPPIFFYLTTSSDSVIRTISYLLPSSALFYGITDIMGGQIQNIWIYTCVLLAHSIICTFVIYKKRHH